MSLGWLHRRVPVWKSMQTACGVLGLDADARRWSSSRAKSAGVNRKQLAEETIRAFPA